MEQGLLEWVAGQTGIMGVATMSLLFLKRAYDQSLAREQQYAEENRADKLQMMALLGENARVMAELRAAIEAYGRRGSESNERR
jgi:hypothetical protein